MNETLLQLCKTGRYDTDKYYDHPYRYHSYIENFYSAKFASVKDSVSNILEIGVFSGGSLKLWKDYFQNATVFGVDLSLPNSHVQRTVQICADAYSEGFISSLRDNYFDIIIDDGPHSPESQLIFVKEYLSKVKDGGLLICEDISSTEVLLELIAAIPVEYKSHVEVSDTRKIDNRFDSLILCVKKGL